MTETTALDLLAKRVRHLETLEEIMSNIHGWDGSAWRKLPLVWGYSDRLIERTVSTDVPAAVLTVDLSSPPEGEAWVITHVMAMCNQANVTSILFYIHDGTIAYSFRGSANPGALLSTEWTGMFVLKHDDYVRVVYSTPALNDDFTTTMFGYKMAIAE